MYETGYRKRIRPSLRSFSFSTAFFLAALCATIVLDPFGNAIYFPILIAALVASGVSMFRLSGLRSSLPPPYGKGKVTRIDSRRTARDGILILLGGVLSMMGLFASVLLVRPALFFFPATFGLMLGLPVSQVIFFGAVTRFENASGSKIFSITEETTEEGKEVLVKSIELRPVSNSRRSQASEPRIATSVLDEAVNRHR